MKKLVLFFLTTLVISCNSKTEDLRSPCVSNPGGPCGPRIPVNKHLG